MARLWTCGFELQSVTAGMEWTTTTASPTISTAVKRSGAASLVTTGVASAVWIDRTYTTTGSATNRYFRAYLYITSAPLTDAIAIMLFRDGTNGNLGNIRLNSDRTLELWDEQAAAQQGSDSAALSLATWYRIELEYVRSTGAITAYIDGNSFATGTTITDADANVFRFGLIDSATAVLQWDDIAVNNSAAGGTQTGLPGEGRDVLALPTGAGDNAATTGDASMIAEIPPTDTATSGSTMVELDSNGVIGEYAMTDSSTLGIDSYDTITLVEVIARIREEAAGTSLYNLRLKSAASGTTSVTGDVDAGNATARTNPTGTTAFTNRLVSYVDPTTTVAWTPTGTNSIDNMQAGLANADAADSTPDLWCLWLGAYIEYVDGAAPGGSVFSGWRRMMGVGQ